MVALHISVFPGSEIPVVTTNSPLCIGDTIHINILQDTATAYSWTGPAGFVSDSHLINIPDASLFNSGTYTLVSSSDSCPNHTIDIEIEVDNYPIATFNYSLETICEGVRAELTNTSQPSNGVLWLFSNGYINNSPVLSYIFNYNETVNVFLIANNNKCKDTTLVSFPNVFPDLVTLPPPNVFTPNSDGFNDCFQLKTSPGFAGCYQMEIFNRWGKRVFILDTSHTCWDGKNQNDGLDCADGVYYYIVTVGAKSYTGTVTLMR
jgi:gliding motility-associated-like protein